MRPIDKLTTPWSNGKQMAKHEQIEQTIEQLAPVLELLALDEGYTLCANEPVNIAENRSTVTCRMSSMNGKPFSQSFTAEEVRRKLHSMNHSAKQQEPLPEKQQQETESDMPKLDSFKKAAKRAGVRLGHPCICGCGKNAKRQFLQGHDAKLHSKINGLIESGKKLDAETRKLASTYITKRWPSEAKKVL